MTRVQITRIALVHTSRQRSLFQRVNFDQSRPHGRQPILAEDNRPVSLVLRVAEKEEEKEVQGEDDEGETRREDEAGTIH